MLFQLPVVYRALRRQKLSALLIAFQTALVLTLVANCVLVVWHVGRIGAAEMGIDIDNIGVVQSIGVVESSAPKSSVASNLIALERLPDVVAASFGDIPLAVSSMKISLHPSMTGALKVNSFDGSQGYVKSLGVEVIDGIDVSKGINGPPVSEPASVYPAMITETLRRRLFGDSGGIGQLLYAGKSRLRVMGIVRELKGQFQGVPNDSYSLISTETYGVEDFGGYYIVRAKPGRLDAVLVRAEEVLRTQNPGHVQAARTGLAELRQKYLGQGIWLARVLAVVGGILLVAMGLGVGALTASWVAQRRQQIGVRRALGARKRDVLVYFVLENLAIVVPGLCIGLVAAFAVNAWLMRHIEIPALNVANGMCAALLVLVVNQCCALWPALRAASVNPADAIRAQ
jgi:putative ABC transport system permease protein